MIIFTNLNSWAIWMIPRIQTMIIVRENSEVVIIYIYNSYKSH